MPDAKAPLLSSRLLVRNTLLNIVGQGFPLLVAIFAIPFLIEGLGTERFGLLTIVWVVIGYFNLFDLGLGRALTQLVAERLGREQGQDIPQLAWSSLALLTALGLVGLVVLGLLSPWLVRALTIPQAIEAEALSTFYILALSIPFVVSTSGLRGLLEAYQRFDLINALRLPLGLFTFMGPLLVLPFSNNLAVVTAALALGRLVAWALHLFLCLKVIPVLREKVALELSILRFALRLGGWMTVTNVVGPLMVTMDRFFIGALVSLTAVAYYTTPYEVITRLWLFSGAMVGVLFPAFASSFIQNREYTLKLFARGVKYIFLALFPITLLIVSLAPEGLELWLGAEFAQNSSSVLRWLAVGVFVNSIAQVPFALLQGIGRPDLTAKLHLVELPLYLLVVFWLISVWSIEGAAIAWTGRVAIDTFFLFLLVRRHLPGSAAVTCAAATSLAGAAIIFALAALPITLTVKSTILLLALFGYFAGTWLLALSQEERAWLQGRLSLTRSSKAL